MNDISLQQQIDSLIDDVEVLKQRRIYQQDIVPNIVLRKPVLNASSNSLVTANDATTIVFDLNAADIHSVTLAGNRTLVVKNVTVGQLFTIRLIQDSVGSRTVTWFTVINWEGATAPTLTTTASRIDVLEFLCTAKSSTVAGGFVFDGYKKAMNCA